MHIDIDVQTRDDAFVDNVREQPDAPSDAHADGSFDTGA